MKNFLLKPLPLLLLFLSFLLPACQSQKPAFNNVPPTTAAGKPGQPVTSQPAVQPVKTVPDSTVKLLYDSTRVSFKKKQKTEVETRFDEDDDEGGPVLITERKQSTVEKYKRREKEKGNWLSGSFLAAGTILLLLALVLAIIGTGPAGWLAIIGGALFLAGFIFTMLALLGR